ncbi:hypothetical protein V8B97DRAFT_1918656 [Scleroderma yunnanense]
MYRVALELRPLGHDRRPATLNSVGPLSGARTFPFGISMANDHPDRAVNLTNLAKYLVDKFVKLGDTAFVEKAIYIDQRWIFVQRLIPIGQFHSMSSQFAIGTSTTDGLLNLTWRGQSASIELY